MLTRTWDAYLNQIIWKITKKLNASKINSTKTNLFGNEITSYRWIRNVKPNWWILLALLSNKSWRKEHFCVWFYFVSKYLNIFNVVVPFCNRQTIFYLIRVQQCCYHFLQTLVSGPAPWSSRRHYSWHFWWPYFVRQQHQSFMSTRTKIGLLTAQAGSGCFTALMWSRRQLHLSPLQPILTQG